MIAPVRPPFDASGYLADLRAAGVQAVKHNGVVFLCPAAPKGGFGRAFEAAQLRWSTAIRAAGSIQAALRVVVPESGTS